MKKFLVLAFLFFLSLNSNFAYKELDNYIWELNLNELATLQEKFETIKTKDNPIIEYAEKEVWKRISEYNLMREYLKDALESAVDKKIISNDEKDYYSRTIAIKYNEIKDWKFSANIIINQDLITIFYDKYLFLTRTREEIKRETQQLLFHEIGHKYAFWKDENQKKAFEKICWNWEKNICRNNDFVSDYALTDKDEDYAETFSYVFSDFWQWEKKWNSFSEKLKHKIEYFKNREF